MCLGDLQDASPAGSERLCDETDATMTAAAVKQPRRRLVDSVEKRVDAAGGKPRLSFKIQINHNVPCWLMTLLLPPFLESPAARRVGSLNGCYDIVTLHNSNKNAMLMFAVRNQRCHGIQHG